MAMNGWGAAEPAWWLNLQADPHAIVVLPGGGRYEVLGRAAVGAERDRLWERWRQIDKNLDSYAARRPRETAVVVLEPRRQVDREGAPTVYLSSRSGRAIRALPDALFDRTR